MPKHIKRASIYIRVSSEKQEEGMSLEHQERKCREYIYEHGYYLDEQFIYREVHTGVEYREREKMTKLRQDARNNLFDVVVVLVYDRLARKQTHQAVILEDLEHYHVKVEAVNEIYEDSPIGMFMRSVMAFVAEIEHSKILYRTSEGKKELVQKGYLLGGKPLYGYSWIDERPKHRRAYKINEEEAEIVRRIFELHSEGYSIRRIAHLLTEEGVPTREGHGHWGESMIAQILKNEYYIGRAAMLKRAYGKNGKSRNFYMKPQEEWVYLPDGVVPPIIDEQMFRAVQERLAQNKIEATRNNQEPTTAILRCGFVRCAYCRTVLNVMKRRHKQLGDFYYCRVGNDRYGRCRLIRMGSKTLDEIVWEKVCEVIRNPEILKASMRETRGTNPTDGEIEPINRRLEQIAREKRNIIRLGQVADTDDAIDALQKSLSLLEKEYKDLQKELQLLQATTLLWEEAQGALAEFEIWCEQVRDKLDTATYEQKRRALRFLGVHVKLFQKEDTPRYMVEFSPPSIVSVLS